MAWFKFVLCTPTIQGNELFPMDLNLRVALLYGRRTGKLCASCLCVVVQCFFLSSMKQRATDYASSLPSFYIQWCCDVNEVLHACLFPEIHETLFFFLALYRQQCQSGSLQVSSTEATWQSFNCGCLFFGYRGDFFWERGERRKRRKDEMIL